MRDHTTYLVHGPGGRLAYLGRLLGGILLNVLFIVLVLHTVFRLAGWVYGWLSRPCGGARREVRSASTFPCWRGWCRSCSSPSASSWASCT